MILKSLGFGIILFCLGFVIFVALSPIIEKQAWYRKLRVMLMPNDFKEANEKIRGSVKEELDKINIIIESEKESRSLKKAGGTKNNGSRNRREEKQAGKFYAGKSSSKNRRSFFGRKKSGGTCELTKS